MSPTPDVTSQLRELSELRAKGELTDGEFEQAKTLLLSSPSDPTPEAPVWRRPVPLVSGIAALVVLGGALALALIDGPEEGVGAQPVASAEGEPAQAASPEEEASSDPTEPPEADADAASDDATREPVEFAAVDWSELEWTTDCTDADGPQPVTLEPAGPLGWDAPGALARQANPDAPAATPGTIYVVEAGTPVLGDITGDGLDDAVFRSECFFGNGSSFLVEVWSHDDGVPIHLPPVLEYTKFDGVIEDVQIVDDAVRIATSEPAPGDDTPHLNGYPTSVVTDWRFIARRWSSTEVSREEPPAAPVAGNYGSDPELDRLWDACAAGDMSSCEFLFVQSPVDSVYEWFGATCGDREEEWVCARLH